MKSALPAQSDRDSYRKLGFDSDYSAASVVKVEQIGTSLSDSQRFTVELRRKTPSGSMPATTATHKGRLERSPLVSVLPVHHCRIISRCEACDGDVQDALQEEWPGIVEDHAQQTERSVKAEVKLISEKQSM